MQGVAHCLYKCEHTKYGEQMNISEIKVQLGIPELKWRPSVDKDGTESTVWLRSWDNDKRIDVHIHAELHAKGKDNDNLSLQVEERTAESGQLYTFARIVEYDDLDVVDTW